LRGAKEEQYLEEHIEETVCYNCGRVLSCVCFLLLLLSIILISPFCYHIWYLEHVRPATRASIWDYNSALLSVFELCSTHIFGLLALTPHTSSGQYKF
jgi:hypothetical protein